MDKISKKKSIRNENSIKFEIPDPIKNKIFSKEYFKKRSHKVKYFMK